MNIAERRKRQNLSQCDLAKMTNLSPARLSQIEAGKRRAPRSLRLALVRLELQQRRSRQIENIWARLGPSEVVSQLKHLMRRDILALYDDHRLEEGDAILQLLPDAEARALLDEYFWDEK